MNPEHYKLVFNVADPNYRPWLGPAIACGAIVTALLVLPLVVRPWQLGFSLRDKLILSAIALIFIAMVVLNFITSFREWRITRQILNSGQAKYVEGKVENFAPMPFSGKGNERFDVQGVGFYYSDTVVTGGFRQTTRDGGPIREGLPVHIWYAGTDNLTHNEILKLEIAGD
jgi:hypothetical protein